MKNNSYINSVNLFNNTNFPYLVLDVIDNESYPRNPGFRVMHWHEDLQFIYVIEQAVDVKTLCETVSLNCGEGIFINKNIVHTVESSEHCHYKSFVFPEYFLEFYLGSPAKALISRITDNSSLQTYKLSLDTEWHLPILQKLKYLSDLEERKNEFYVYEVLVSLTSIWLQFQQQLPFSVKEHNTVKERMRIFLQYLNEHYFENITLEKLSTSANVSKSECLRCFKNSLGTTPYRYLMDLRLSKVADMLENTSKTIGEIACCVGFNQLSYFGKCFKEKLKCSPKEYRKNINGTIKSPSPSTVKPNHVK